MRVLVTGANGYVGRAVVESLNSHGHETVALVRSRGSEIARVDSVRVGDLLDAESLRQAVRGVDAVCHLAGLTRARESIQEPLPFFRTNTAGTIALLDAMDRANVRRMVFASTGAIYGTPRRQPMTEDLPASPPHPYASSKLAAEFAIEAQCRAGQLSAIVLRILNVAGGKDPDPTRLIPRAISAATGESVLPVNGDGSAIRDYLHISDAADAFVAGVEHLPKSGLTTYNIGSGSGVSVAEVISAVERATERKVSVEHRPPADEPIKLVCDPTKAIKELEWSPSRSSIDAIVRDAWSSSLDAR